MDGYNAIMHIARAKPEYLPLIRKCVEAHHKEQNRQYCVGFEWHDVGAFAIHLYLLATKYDSLKITHKTDKKTYYMVKDIEGAEKALHDIAAARVATPSGQGRALRVWLSDKTTQRLSTYLSNEFSDGPAAESIVVERAVNLFLDKADEEKTKTRD